MKCFFFLNSRFLNSILFHISLWITIYASFRRRLTDIKPSLVQCFHIHHSVYMSMAVLENRIRKIESVKFVFFHPTLPYKIVNFQMRKTLLPKNSDCIFGYSENLLLIFPRPIMIHYEKLSLNFKRSLRGYWVRFPFNKAPQLAEKKGRDLVVRKFYRVVLSYPWQPEVSPWQLVPFLWIQLWLLLTF